MPIPSTGSASAGPPGRPWTARVALGVYAATFAPIRVSSVTSCDEEGRWSESMGAERPVGLGGYHHGAEPRSSRSCHASGAGIAPHRRMFVAIRQQADRAAHACLAADRMHLLPGIAGDRYHDDGCAGRRRGRDHRRVRRDAPQLLGMAVDVRSEYRGHGRWRASRGRRGADGVLGSPRLRDDIGLPKREGSPTGLLERRRVLVRGPSRKACGRGLRGGSRV